MLRLGDVSSWRPRALNPRGGNLPRPVSITTDRTWASLPCDHRYTYHQHRRTDCRISTENNARGGLIKPRGEWGGQGFPVYGCKAVHSARKNGNILNCTDIAGRYTEQVGYAHRADSKAWHVGHSDMSESVTGKPWGIVFCRLSSIRYGV